jgi:GAF domain-containing protein
MINSSQSSLDLLPDTYRFSFKTWRQSFLQGILRSSLVVGALFLLVSFLTATAPILLVIYSCAYILLITSSILRLPYLLKATFYLAVILALGISGLFENGLRGDTRVWLIIFSILATLLFGSKIGWIANGINATTLIVFGWLILTSRIVILNGKLDLGNIDAWVMATLENVGVVALISAGISRLENDFQRAQATATTALETLQQERVGLDALITKRTSSLERTASQLKAASFIAREASLQKDLNTLLARTVAQISRQFNIYHAGIFLVDDNKEHAVLMAASSEAGQKLLQRGHRVAISLQGIVSATAFFNRPTISFDTEKDPNNLQTPELAATQSEIAIPLHVSKGIIGVLDLQSSEKQAFIEDDIQVFQIMADQISLAIENALLITESQTVIQRLESVTQENVRKTWKERADVSGKAYRYTSAGLTQLNTIGRSRSRKTGKSDDMNIPIILHSQQIGMIELRRGEQDSWTDTDQAMVKEISSQIALALENARLLEGAQQRAAQEQFLNTLSSQVGQNLDVNTILETTLRELHQLPKISEVSVYLSPKTTSKVIGNDLDTKSE